MRGLYDNHNHSQFSFDGKRTSVERTARAAAAKGLAGLCFTDHCDLYVPAQNKHFTGTGAQPQPTASDDEHQHFDIEGQQREIDRVCGVLMEEGEKLQIFKGIEVGVYKDSRDMIAETLRSHSFDQIIASVHYIDGTDPFWGGYYVGKSWKEAYERYLEVLLEEMIWLGDGFDVMGHYDYVARYAPYPVESILYRDFPDIFDEIFRFLSEKGKALELNTKTYQLYKGRLPEPDKDIYMRFRELGGEMVSLGSDSHDAEAVGTDFDRYTAFLLSAGFRYTVHFDNRNPVFSGIED